MLYPAIKRTLDLAVSLMALIVLLPLLLVLAILIVTDDPGSPLFLQLRVGRGGRLFRIVKFRSMVKDAPSRGPYWTQDNDPRITRVGRLLRITSLDELPQLWNVLIGDMSLIGPRPDTPAQEKLYRPEDWQRRHRVRPGVTGLAQVNGRSAALFDERLRYDLQYADHPTLAMDFLILVKTIGLVLRKSDVN